MGNAKRSADYGSLKPISKKGANVWDTFILAAVVRHPITARLDKLTKA